MRILKLSQINLTFVNGKWIINTPDFIKKEFSELATLESSELIRELQSHGFLRRRVICSGCQSLISTLTVERGRHPRFRCRSRSCNQRINRPLFENTIFSKTKISLELCLEVLYNFSCRRTVADTSETLNISKPTVISFYKLFRSSITLFLENYSQKLGGDSIIVHVDETPMTTRHGGTGRHSASNTVWVVGGVDIHTRSCFLRFLPSRSRSDLFEFLNEWVLPGSIVHTDRHRSYDTLCSLGFTHFRVNHSTEFVAPDGTHTNWIEGMFGVLKKLARKYDSTWSGVTNLNLFLSEFCFRYSFDAWNRKKAFLKMLAVLKFCREKLDEEDNE